MNGKDLLETLKYVDNKYYREAEADSFPPSAKQRWIQKLLVATALVVLAGCAIAYVLHFRGL